MILYYFQWYGINVWYCIISRDRVLMYDIVFFPGTCINVWCIISRDIVLMYDIVLFPGTYINV